MGAIFTLALVDASGVQVAEVLRNRLAQRRKDLSNEGPCIGHDKYDRYEVRRGFFSGHGHRRPPEMSGQTKAARILVLKVPKYRICTKKTNIRLA